MKKAKFKKNINTSGFWDTTYEKMIDETRLRVDKRLPGRFISYYTDAKSILDFGCGLGGNIHNISQHLDSKDFILVDHSKVPLEFAEQKLMGKKDERNNTFTYLTDISDLGDASIQMIMCLQVLEHISDYNSILDMLWAKLAEGGTLLISVPVRGFRDRNRQHVNKFTIKSMFSILTKYAPSICISPRDYSKRSGILSTAFFLLKKEVK